MILTLEKRIIEAPGVETFVFRSDSPLSWQAGQFIHYVLSHEPADNRGADRWFTISTAPYEEKIALTTRFDSERSSSFKSQLIKLEAGETILAKEIGGGFLFASEQAEQHHVFIAGGIGITPYRSILKQLAHEDKQPEITLIYANRDQNFVYQVELEQLAEANPNLKIHYLADPERLSLAKIQELAPDLNSAIVYISGPKGLVKTLEKDLREAGVREDNLRLDGFPGYPEGY